MAVGCNLIKNHRFVSLFVAFVGVSDFLKLGNMGIQTNLKNIQKATFFQILILLSSGAPKEPICQN